MAGIIPATRSPEEIARYFAERKIPVYCIARADAIRAPAGRHPRDILPGCRTIIIFGIPMPDRLFSGTEAEQVAETDRLREALESSATGLRDILVQAGAASEAILPSLPLKVEEGILRGRLSLKHCAADAGFGTIGDNTLLVHPRYGNRLALAAVLTAMALDPLPIPAPLPECTHCNRCATACPDGAIHDGAVRQTLCRNLSDYVPRPVRPLAWRLMRGRYSARIATVLLNMAASCFEIRSTCSACVTACPYFHKGKQ